MSGDARPGQPTPGLLYAPTLPGQETGCWILPMELCHRYRRQNISLGLKANSATPELMIMPMAEIEMAVKHL
jgi:hypothetical protein